MANCIQKQSLLLIVLLNFITIGLYFWFWLYQTKEEINVRGGKIPSLWFAVIPILNIFFYHEYVTNLLRYVLPKYKNNKFAFFFYFLLLIFMPWVAQLFIQSELNEYVCEGDANDM